AGSLGVPDLGITTLDDVLTDVRRITGVTRLPLLVDADTGFGGAFNIARTVRSLIASGAGAMHIEDQVQAKRCGHRPGKAIVAKSEMIDRIKAAVDARTDPDFVIMARTDALAVEGIECAIDRAVACVEAGADMIFPEAVTELAAYRRFADAVHVPILANITEFGVTPLFAVDELASAGVGIVLYPLSPVRAMSAQRARHYRERFESLETRAPDIKKMKTKSHLLCPWVLDIAEDPYILDLFEDLIGPNIRCWSMAWRVKKADGETFAGWHQDSFYGSAVPVVLGALALSECGSRQGCLRGIPGSHRWGILRHEETDDPRSILARGQYITEPFDESKAVDFELRPGEMAMFDNSLVHGSAGNFGPDRRFLLLVEMLPTWAKPT